MENAGVLGGLIMFVLSVAFLIALIAMPFMVWSINVEIKKTVDHLKEIKVMLDDRLK